MQFLTSVTLLTLCGLTLSAPYYHQHKHHAPGYGHVIEHDAYNQHDWDHKEHDVEHHHSHDSAADSHNDHGDLHEYDYHDKHAKYEFDYGVKDLKTGDVKNQWEHRDGDHVKGGYSFIEADGTTRIVEYTADDHNGFKAVVKKIGHADHSEVHHAKPAHHSDWETYSGHDDHKHHHAHHGHAANFVRYEHH